MSKKYWNWVLILVPAIIVFSIFVFLFYIHTNIGFSETIFGLVPMYAPAWLEALITTLFIPFMIGFSIYDEIYGI